MNEDVLGLDIPMADAMRVHEGEATSQTSIGVQKCGRHRSLLRGVDNAGVQVEEIEEVAAIGGGIEDHGEGVVRAVACDCTDDVGVAGEAAGDVYFVFEGADLGLEGGGISVGAGVDAVGFAGVDCVGGLVEDFFYDAGLAFA